jgi:formylglycine-generating enzyme required for sulfatase activity
MFTLTASDGPTPYRGVMTQIIGRILAAPVPSATELHEDVDPRLEAICFKAMAKEPEERFASMTEFAQALERFLRPAVVPPPLTVVPAPVPTFVETPEPISRPRSRKRGRSVMWVVALALMLPLSVLLALLVLRMETPEGTLIVEMDGDEVAAKIKGGKLVLAGADGKMRYTLSAKERKKSLAEGRYTLRVEDADDLSVDTPDFTMKKGEKVTVRVRLEKAGVQKVGQFEYITNSIGMKFVKIPAGEFMRGADGFVDHEAEEDEKPRRKVKISSFWCGVYEVTQGQYQKVMGTNPSEFKDGDDHPVERVSWNETQEFIAQLNEMPEEKKTGRKYRLLREAQWEYACRGSVLCEVKYKKFHTGDTLTIKQANFDESGLNRPCNVGSYPANAFGVHDMHGNVWEWCEDWKWVYPNKEETDPTGPSDGNSRVCRGGGWKYNIRCCRSAHRDGNSPTLRLNFLGFRVALVLF